MATGKQYDMKQKTIACGGSPLKTFKHYLESKGHSKEALKMHERHLHYFLNWCEDENIEPEQATYSEMISYIKHLKKRGIKQRTVQIYTNSLTHYFNWLIKLGKREDLPDGQAGNPTRNIDIKGIQRRYLYDILPQKELESLYENYETQEKGNLAKWQEINQLTTKRNKVIIGLLIWQGLGARELSRLTVNDLKLREGKIYIAGGRRSNERELKLEAPQILDLMEYSMQVREKLLAPTGKETDKLLVSKGTGEKINNTLHRFLERLKAQNPRVTSLKQIRASVIIHWLKNYNLREVQYMAGHRYVSSTENYLLNDLDDLTEEISKYHPIG